MFWNNFLAQCAKKGKSPAVVAEELGFSNSATTCWKNGSLPRMSSRKKIAEYFGITVDELMGTKKEPAGMGGLKWEWADVEAGEARQDKGQAGRVQGVLQVESACNGAPVPAFLRDKPFLRRYPGHGGPETYGSRRHFNDPKDIPAAAR